MRNDELYQEALKSLTLGRLGINSKDLIITSDGMMEEAFKDVRLNMPNQWVQRLVTNQGYIGLYNLTNYGNSIYS